MTASTRLTLLTRIGFATRGLLYIVIALLVIRTGRSEDTSGALRYLGQGAVNLFHPDGESFCTNCNDVDFPGDLSYSNKPSS